VTTAINAGGVRLMARINNIGVFTELVGVVLLIVLLLARARHGPGILFQLRGSGALGWLSPLLAAAVMPSYVMYGFDTAGTLAEETKDPRRRAPWAILRALGAAGCAGGLLIVAGLLAASDPSGTGLGEMTGGLSAVVKEALGPELGALFLVTVIFAISVCALAVHAGTVRLIFAMARDNSLPFARTLAIVSEETGTPIVPAGVTGAAACLILLANVNVPKIIESLCSVAIVWANLAYLMVSLPLLWTRLRGWPGNLSIKASQAHRISNAGRFALGRWALGVNIVAVGWGIFVVVNMSWPRPEIYGTDPWGRFAAVLATTSLLCLGVICHVLVGRRRRLGILAEHSAGAEEVNSGTVLAAWPVPAE
jgi:amino acid transporter